MPLTALWPSELTVIAGRPDLRLHYLRHTGAVLAAQTGATLAELMARLGHSAPAAAMRYQHAARDRDAVIAAALSKLAAEGPTSLTTRTLARVTRLAHAALAGA